MTDASLQPRARLGFGCAALPIDQPRLARSLVACAFEHGVRHFDVAHLYGYGEVEKLVGDVLHDKRDRVTITTKFGLDTGQRTLRTKLADRARLVLQMVPRLHDLVKRAKHALRPPGPWQPPIGHFDLETARSSLDASLRSLRTDYIDYWLLHESTAALAADEPLLAYFARLREEGRVRHVGTGTCASTLLADASAYPPDYTIFQFDSHVLNRAIEQFPRRAGAQLFTHGSLWPLRQCREMLAALPAAVERFQRDTGYDLLAGDMLPALLLQWAMVRNPEGIVLFFSRNPDHIRDNLRTIAETPVSDAALAALPDVFRTPEVAGAAT